MSCLFAQQWSALQCGGGNARQRQNKRISKPTTAVEPGMPVTRGKKLNWPPTAPYALRVGHAFSDFSDHSRRLRFRGMSWPGQNDLGPFAVELSRIAGHARNAQQT